MYKTKIGSIYMIWDKLLHLSETHSLTISGEYMKMTGKVLKAGQSSLNINYYCFAAIIKRDITETSTFWSSVSNYSVRVWSQFLKLQPEHLSIHVGSPIHSLQNTDVNQEWLSFTFVTEATSLLVINISSVIILVKFCFVFWRSLQSFKKKLWQETDYPSGH